MVDQVDKSEHLEEGIGSRRSEEELLRWRKRNSYYYKWLEKIHRFSVRPNSRALHVGCESGVFWLRLIQTKV